MKGGKPKPWMIKELCEVITWGGVCGAEEGLSVSSYSGFMKKRGTMGGCQGGTYSGAYVFLRRKGPGRSNLRRIRGRNVRKRKCHFLFSLPFLFLFSLSGLRKPGQLSRRARRSLGAGSPGRFGASVCYKPDWKSRRWKEA